MKVLLLQLSDIHFHDGRPNPAAGHAGLIVQAVRNLEYDLDRCVIVLSGDIAYGGRESEYLLAVSLVGAVQQGLLHELRGSPPVTVVGTPGNHDCILVPEPKARSYTIDGLLRQQCPDIDENVVAECTEPQSQFFQFLDLVDEGREGDRLVHEYRLGEDNDALFIRCYNTAWLSRIPENQGDLYFPVERMIDAPDVPGVVISVFHHPYHWLRQGNYREFRKRIEAFSDLVLTGHEHMGDLRQAVSALGASLYVEGAALQPHGWGETAGFNVVLLDTLARTQRVIRFAWSGELYSRRGSEPEWEPFQIPLRRTGAFDLLEESERWLDDLELTVKHPTAGHVKLSDVFVPNDLEAGGEVGGHDGRLLRGEMLAGEVLLAKRLVITGPEKSGKTAVAKLLFRSLMREGLVPIFIDARTANLRADRLNEDLAELCTRLYGAKSVEAYSQLDRARRVLIVDDAHRLHLKGQPVALLVSRMCEAADHVVLFANDLVQSLGEATYGGPDGAGTAKFDYLRLQEMGHERRHQLAERWYSLDPTVANDPAVLSRKVIEAKKMVDGVVGLNFVPAYPVFLIPILQGHDSQHGLDLSASTYGYFYELLIKSSLLEGSPAKDMDIRLAYLTHLAAKMLRSGVEEVTEAELLKIHQQFMEERLVEIRFTSLVQELVRRGVLTDKHGCYQFRYRYIRYYFTARHLAETIQSAETQTHLQHLTENLHSDEEANQLLFLAHLSRDQSIINGMLRQAERVFAKATKAALKGTLTRGSEKAAHLFEALPRGSEAEHSLDLAVDDRPVVERQRALMRALDESNGEGDSDTELEIDGVARASTNPSPTQLAELVMEEEDISTLQVQLDAVQEIMQRFAVAYRTLQILGQTVKNFPGSMRGDEKLQVVDAAYGVGLRTLGALLELLNATADVAREGIAEAIRKTDPLAPDSVVWEKAQRTISGLAHMASHALIRRIASAIGSRDLDPVYDRLLTADPTPAMEVVRMAIRLEQFSEQLPREEIERLATTFKGVHPRAHEVLRHLVYSYLQMYEVGYVEKQAVCSHLGISYTKVVATNPDRKLLRKGPGVPN